MLYENHLERSFTMKKTLTILPLCMAVSLSASILPSVTALASPFPAQICDEPDNDPGIMPYYLLYPIHGSNGGTWPFRSHL